MRKAVELQEIGHCQRDDSPLPGLLNHDFYKDRGLVLLKVFALNHVPADPALVVFLRFPEINKYFNTVPAPAVVCKMPVFIFHNASPRIESE